MNHKLVTANEAHTLVRLWRDRIEDGFVTGYVAGVGPAFFLLHLVDDDITFNGFLVLRISDITEVEAPHEFAAFIERALHLRGAGDPEVPTIDLSSIASILESAARSFPLVAIHREDLTTEICHIGRPVAIDDGVLRLQEMSPDAVLDDDPEDYRLGEITRVDFGGGYEDALWLVGSDNS